MRQFKQIILSTLILCGMWISASAQSIWINRSSAGGTGGSSVIWTGTLFVTVGGGGKIITSQNGISWTNRSVGDTIINGKIVTPGNLTSVAWMDTQFLAVSNSKAVVTSRDGTTWTVRPDTATGGLNSITWTGTVSGSGAKQLVAVGLGGKILT